MNPEDPACAGCGKRHPRGDLLRHVEVAPGVILDVCPSQFGPHKQSCLAAAREARRACPGCGAGLSLLEWRRRALCAGCCRTLDRERAFPSEPRAWYGINPREIFGGYLGTYQDKSHAAYEQALGLVKVLGRALGRAQQRQPPGWDCHDPETVIPRPGGSPPLGGYHESGMVFAELTREQADALRELGTALAGVGTAQFERGRARGHDLLGALARGEITWDTYEQKKR